MIYHVDIRGNLWSHPEGATCEECEDLEERKDMFNMSEPVWQR